jgi:hypothetical protein
VRHRALRSHADAPRGLLLPLPHVPAGLRNTRVAFPNLRKVQVRWLTRPPAYNASSKIARRGFSSRCGTPLRFEFLDGGNMDLSVGSLDDPGLLRPTEHFGVESRIEGWRHDDGLTASRTDDNAGIRQRWRQACGEDVQPGLQAVRGALTMPPSPSNKDPG